MGQRGQPGAVDCGDQDARGDTDGFRHIVVLGSSPVVGNAVTLGEDHDQVGCRLQERLVLVGAERPECL